MVISTTPVRRKSTTGRRLVAGIGIASVIHQAAIQCVLGNAAFADGEMSNVGKRRKPVNSDGPRINPITVGR